MVRQVGDGPPLPEHRERAKQHDAECFTKAVARSEQTFTLIERDPSAPKTILFWIMQNWETSPPGKLRDAFEDALAMQFSPITKKHPD